VSGEVLSLCEQADKFRNLELRGLMAVPPLLEDPQEMRPFFRRLRELRDQALRAGIVGGQFRELSMGMSNDFEVAIEEGATFVRIGTAIFGPRVTDN
jgi:PLP dependent protein